MEKNEIIKIDNCVCGSSARHQRIKEDTQSIICCKKCLRSSPIFTTRTEAVLYWNKINKHLIVLNLSFEAANEKK